MNFNFWVSRLSIQLLRFCSDSKLRLWEYAASVTGNWRIRARNAIKAAWKMNKNMTNFPVLSVPWPTWSHFFGCPSFIICTMYLVSDLFMMACHYIQMFGDTLPCCLSSHEASYSNAQNFRTFIGSAPFLWSTDLILNRFLLTDDLFRIRIFTTIPNNNPDEIMIGKCDWKFIFK